MLFGVVFLLACLAGAGLYLWSAMSGHWKAEPFSAQNQAMPIETALPDETIALTVYYPMDGILVAETVSVKRQPDSRSQAREAVAAILSDRRSLPAPALGALRLRELYIDAAGTAYIDLSPVPPDGVRASAWDELLATYALVNTLQQNFEGIRQVRILLEGREAQTLAGHIDVSRAFSRRMDLVKQ